MEYLGLQGIMEACKSEDTYSILELQLLKEYIQWLKDELGKGGGKKDFPQSSIGIKTNSLKEQVKILHNERKWGRKTNQQLLKDPRERLIGSSK